MIRRQSEFQKDERTAMRGGSGTVKLEPIWKKGDGLRSNVRMYSKIVLEPGTSIGYHVHENEEEIFFVVSGRAEADDNGTKVILETGDSIVTRVALCGGAGGFLLDKAVAQGAQLYVTADMRYHDFLDNAQRIVVADIGHYESEHFTKEIFLEIIQKKNPTFAVDFAKKETNQVNYL